MKLFTKLARKSKLLIAGAVLAVAIATVGTVGFSPAKALAASCDQVNIIHCGLNGSSLGGYIGSIKDIYNTNNDNGHTDLQAIFAWAGLSSADVSNMNTDNTKLGTLYRDGTVKVNGETVATDAWVSARFNGGDGFVKIKDGVWARKTTTSFENASVQVLVHYNGNLVDAVVMINCGNAVKVTPVRPVLKCEKLTGAATSTALTYSFTATASARNTQIVKYVFDFGDNSLIRPVLTNATTTTVTHKFAAYSKSYTVRVTVYSADDSNTNANCAVTITTPPAPIKPALVCKSLTATIVRGSDTDYTLVATALPTKTTITRYVFDFSDSTTKTVETSAKTASAVHTFAPRATPYVATVKVYSNNFPNGVTSVDCKVSVSVPVQPCTPKPGEDQNCNPIPPTCVPTETQNANCVEKPKELANSGPGAIAGLFAGTSVFGAAAHQIIRRRMNRG